MNLSKTTLNLQVWIWLRKLLRNYPFRTADIEAMQCKKLQELVQHAYQKPFYKKRFDDAGVDPAAVRSPADLEKLPVLSKDDYRRWLQEEYKRAPKLYDSWYRDGTSGSTGMPLTVYRPWNEQAYIIAKWLRELRINGYRPLRDKVCCMVSPHRINKRDSVLQKFGLLQRRAISYLSTPEEMVAEYNNCKPDLFYANKSQMLQMAQSAQENGIELHSPRIYACGAETLDANSRRIIQDAFGESGYFETYGCVELGILGFQVAGGRYFYHFCHDTNILELVTEDEAGVPQQSRCLITDLHQHAFPVIRYDIGDVLQTEVIDGLPVIRQIQGRMDDWVIFNDGTRIPFHAFYEIMERRPEVRQFRIIQEKHTLIRLQIAAEKDVNLSRLESILFCDLLKEVRADGMEYQFEWLDEIPPDPNGKLRMLISKVDRSNP